MRKLISILIVMLLVNVSFGATFEDDMEYADESALDAAWVNTTPGWWTGGDWTLNTTIAQSGSKSMEMLDDGGATNRGGTIWVAGGADIAPAGSTIGYSVYIDTANNIIGAATLELWGPGNFSGMTYVSDDPCTVGLDVVYDDYWDTGPVGIGTFNEGWNDITIHVDSLTQLTVSLNGAPTVYPTTWDGGARFTFHNPWVAGGTIIDDVFIIPEPMTICLLGFGGLLLRRRKR